MITPFCPNKSSTVAVVLGGGVTTSYLPQNSGRSVRVTNVGTSTAWFALSSSPLTRGLSDRIDCPLLQGKSIIVKRDIDSAFITVTGGSGSTLYFESGEGGI